MANEGKLTVSLAFAYQAMNFTAGVQDLGFDVAGSVVLHNRQEVSAGGGEALVLGDAGTGGYLLAINRDTTNSVSMRGATGDTEFVTMKPGEAAVFRLHAKATAPFVEASAATVELEYWLIEA